ncbi:uncharacterized protein CANTADRAFT_43558 [Suhomyces tanzawaensis NRRL Y-17324]|uniref:RFX-type winged-helix domain-containing protein n=1 Tax=Suhomyces tanzawaensis NRRL Y-17324 TaxID=984487 RepID=A0A1E4SPJ6_9ASCO|nr:uncharacterized protein CANTADRAFT_43558 [Suhomyces tanzawaensis NRRL Y-17324]ODV81408.1 hypothetical protein CANTADRAFT_43558 [Suhomyces tanzawaensis NRRL Y-17324]
MSNGLLPISVASRTITNLSGEPNGYGTPAYNGFMYPNNIGHNHRGVEEVQRIIMSLKSGIESEVKWSLSTLTRVSVHPVIMLEDLPFVGNELIKFFIRPFHWILEQKPNKVNQTAISFSLDSLLTLRNLSQDLSNQQWLSQIKPLKKHIIEVLRFLLNWFYVESHQIHSLKVYENQFKEALGYLLDLLEPLSCYYIDNTKNDPLFNLLLNFSTITNDKAVFVSIIKTLSHLLIIREKATDGNDTNGEDDSPARTPNNCIDSIKDTHLESIVNQLLINDNDLAFTVLEFLKQYLTSEALHPEHPSSVKDSQNLRLEYLLQINSSKSNFNTLVKQLPLLTVSNLPLNDVSSIRPISQLTLTKRSHFSGVPSTLPDLPPELYSLIVRFPEPLRATTWLRCCYEPFTNQVSNNPESTDVVPGEVTQISLWKAYEKQFQEIWDSADGKQHPEYKALLPAVDFIKNVSHAFPNSEAMVVALEPPTDPPKKKFIIKGIQPRQFAVNIDVGNYEALKPIPVSSINPSENYKLPIGHVEPEKFDHALNSLSESILSSNITKSLEAVTPINLTACELLDYIIDEVLETRENSTEENIFRLYNSHWLPDTVYSNPSLVEGGLINPKWLKYLI